jgi:hypothetical protein
MKSRIARDLNRCGRINCEGRMGICCSVAPLSVSAIEDQVPFATEGVLE